MNHWDIQQNAMVGCEEIRGSASIIRPSFSDLKAPVICPKPRRAGFLANHSAVSLRWCQRSIQGDQLDSKAGAELDMILTKDCYGVVPKEVEPSPFLSGSPPTRVSNPLVQNAIFRDEKPTSPLSTLQFLLSPGSPSPSSPSRCNEECSKIKFGLKPAVVRVEGFDCLSRDRQNSGITAFA